MINIEIKDNYIYLENSDNNIITDRPSCDITIVKKYTDSTSYTVYYRGGTIIDSLCGVEWSDFTLDGVPFANQAAFEDWKNLNTANCGGSSGGTGGNVTIDNVPLPVTFSNTTVNKTPIHSRTNGSNTYLQPFKSFSLTAYSNDVTINGQAIERGQVINLPYEENSLFDADQVVTGTDYLVTYTV